MLRKDMEAKIAELLDTSSEDEESVVAKARKNKEILRGKKALQKRIEKM